MNTPLTSEQLLAAINKAIASLPLDRQPRGLYEPVRYVLSLGGKRIRPVLMMMTYALYRDNPLDILAPAVALETYHNYTLMHDDLMDRADIRRGQPTVHTRWSDNTAILSGDSMQILAVEGMLSCAPKHLPEAMRLLTTTALEIGEGQQYDMDFETRDDVSEQEYLEMIRLKTSVLLACAMRLGALLADAPEADAASLYRAGERLGMAFQLQDDYLDVYGDERVFGKRIGGDILCNKKTYMLINALLLASPQQRTELMGWLKTSDCDPEDKIRAVTRLYDETGVPALALERIGQYVAEASEALDSLPVPEARKAPLRDYMNQLLGRRQ